MRRLSCLAAAFALVHAPGAFAGGLMTVGYATPSSLHGLRVVSRIPALHTAEIRLSGRATEQRLRARPGIRFVERVRVRRHTGGPPVPAEWQWTATHADLVPSWVLAAAAGKTIAIVDTGADLTAPTLAAKNPVAFDVVTGTADVHDVVGHGTFVASIAGGAFGDLGGMTGFGGDAKLMIVEANRGSRGVFDVDEAHAIVWAVDHGANIINLSIGGPQTSTVERSAVAYAESHGVLLVTAAGNGAQMGNPTMYPAALIGTGGIVVGAATADGHRAPFSSTGHYVDVLAPGVDVLGAVGSGLPAGAFDPAELPGGGGSYGFGTGTSYAAPQVAGAAALVWAANPTLDAAGVAATLEATASGAGTWTTDLAFGNIDIAAAVARASFGGSAPFVTKPIASFRPPVVKRRARPRVWRGRT